MALKLPEGMNEHYGRNIEQMSELLKAGEVPISAARLMQARLKYGNDFPDLWKYADTSDLPIYPRTDKFGNDFIYTFLTVNNKNQIANNHARQALELINPLNLTSNYGAIVSDGMFEEWRDKGDEIGLIKIPRREITTGTCSTQDQVLKELTWRILARHPDEVPTESAEDKNLLREYFGYVASKTNSLYNMALYINDSLKDKTTLKAWYVCGLGDDSDASGRYCLDDGLGCLVGLAPEALSIFAREKNFNSKP